MSAGEDGEVGVEEYNHQHRDLYRWRIEVQGTSRRITSATKLTLVMFLVTVVFLSLLLSMSSCYG